MAKITITRTGKKQVKLSDRDIYMIAALEALNQSLSSNETSQIIQLELMLQDLDEV